MSCEQWVVNKIIPGELRRVIEDPNRGDMAALLAEDRLLSLLDPGYRLRLYLRPIFRLLGELQVLDREFPNGQVLALESFFARLNIRCGAVCPPEARKVLRQGACVPYGPHPVQIDAFALAWAAMKYSERPAEVIGVAADYMGRIGPNVAAQMALVFEENEELAEARSRMPFLDRLGRLMVNLLREPGITKDEAASRLVGTLRRLAGHLERQGIVLITPQIGKSKGKSQAEREWDSGIGVVDCLVNREMPVNYLPVNFYGDLGWRALFSGGTIIVHFGLPLSRTDLNARVSGRISHGIKRRDVITSVLREHHQSCFA